MHNNVEINAAEDALSELRSIPRFLNNISYQLINKSAEECFMKIVKTIERLGQPPAPPKPPRSQYYIRQWLQFKKNIIEKLERPALKHLCWECSIVKDPKFSDYLNIMDDELSGRAIKGLVYSLHVLWTNDLPKTSIVRFTERKIRSFNRKDRTLAKWKSDIGNILGNNAPLLFAMNVLLKDFKSLKMAADEWAIEEQSEFMRAVAIQAAEKCFRQVGANSSLTDYLFKTLLEWRGWDANASGFKMIVSKLILHERVDEISERLRSFVLKHPLLGDPRFPINWNKWRGMDEMALQKFRGWLAREDIIFFFDHVLKGRDRHGRRAFWLKYVENEKMISSRPFLSDSIAWQFKDIQNINFGRLTSSVNQAAFVLDFGSIIVVEFSDLGRIYLYERQEFDKLIPNMWLTRHISENELKNTNIPKERMIRHQDIRNIVNVDWRVKAASILAKEGVRQ